MGKVIMPDENRKVVGINNQPLKRDEDGEIKADMPKLDRIVGALREMADKIESGEISEPEFMIVIPKLKDGEMPVMLLGDPMPTVYLEGVMHKIATRMALQN